MNSKTYPTTDMCDGEILSRFEATTRDTDVFVTTAAKCGQTWLTTLLHHIKTRGDDPDLGGIGLMGVVPWLEIPRKPGASEPWDRDERLASIAAQADPRIFKLHVLYEEVPRASGSKAPILTVTRDPRDLPFSMFSHLEAMVEERQPPFVKDGFDTYFETWLETGYIFKFVNSMWPHRDDDDLLWLRFEDLKAEPQAQAQRLVDFLGWSRSPVEIERAVDLASFDTMQKTEKTTLLGSKTPFRADRRFVREGAVGKNRARLSSEQERSIVERARSEWAPEAVDFIFSQGL